LFVKPTHKKRRVSKNPGVFQEGPEEVFPPGTKWEEFTTMGKFPKGKIPKGKSFWGLSFFQEFLGRMVQKPKNPLPGGFGFFWETPTQS